MAGIVSLAGCGLLLPVGDVGDDGTRDAGAAADARATGEGGGVSTDASSVDGAATDGDRGTGGGAPCTLGDTCDDGNPCTADECIGGSCANAPLADGIACDDGLFCNSGDTCAGGVCLPGPTDACGGMVCNETTDTCAPCRRDSDCPPTTLLPVGECILDSFCDESGTHASVTHTYRCVMGLCDRTSTMGTYACGMPTEGLVCQDPSCSPVSLCGYPSCDGTTPMQVELCVESVCQASACTGERSYYRLSSVPCAGTAVLPAVEGAVCDDGNPRTFNDRCSGTACIGCTSSASCAECPSAETACMWCMPGGACGCTCPR